MNVHTTCVGCRRQSWRPWLMGVAILSAPVVETDLATAGLYACRNEAGTLIYTDSPAQLKGCQPVGGGGSSRVGAVGGASPSPSVTPVAPAPTPPVTVPPSPSSSDPTADSSAVAPAGGPPSPDESPCTPVVNPLNPLSAPPCSTTTVPSSPSSLPAPPPGGTNGSP